MYDSKSLSPVFIITRMEEKKSSLACPLSSSAQPEGGRLDRAIYSLAFPIYFYNLFSLENPNPASGVTSNGRITARSND
jgi:hypothetical protein